MMRRSCRLHSATNASARIARWRGYRVLSASVVPLGAIFFSWLMWLGLRIGRQGDCGAVIEAEAIQWLKVERASGTPWRAAICSIR